MMHELMNIKVKVVEHKHLHSGYFGLTGEIVGYRHDAQYKDRITSDYLVLFNEEERIAKREGLASCLWLPRDMFVLIPS